jgi:O-antigen/teichoic acid export membrane protein
VSQARIVFRNTAVLAGARIIERTSGLLLALLITRHLGAAALGIYATAVAYFGLIQLAGESGSTNLLIRELSKVRERTASYVVHTSIMALTFSIVVMAIALLVIPHLGYGRDLQRSLELIVLAVAPGTLNTIQEAVFIAHQRVEFETITTFVSSSALVALSFALVEGGHGVVSVVFAFVVLEYAVTFVYFVLISRYIARLRFEFHWELAKEILREMKTFAGSSIVAGIFARPEIVILSLVATEAQVGYYSGTLKIVDLFQFIPQVYMTNVFPLLSRSFHAVDGRARELQDLSLKYLLAFGLPVAAGLATAAPRIIEAFYGDEFGNGILLLRILSINVILYCTNAVFWRVLAARGRQDIVLRVQVVTAATRIAGGIGIISALRALGAALTAPGVLVIQAVLFMRGMRRTETAPSNLLGLSWRFALAAAVMGAFVLAVMPVLSLWLIVPLAACVYCVLLVVFRAFSSSEMEVFRTLLPSLRPQRAA